MNVVFRAAVFLTFICKIYVEADKCGDWKPYKDEKCFKVIEKVGTQEEVAKLCIELDHTAFLAAIRSKDEQDFLSTLVFKELKVVDNVWIGAGYGGGKFKWYVDSSELSYSNWAEGSPKDGEEKSCVQMMSSAPSTGKWVNELCAKKTVALCEKPQK